MPIYHTPSTRLAIVVADAAGFSVFAIHEHGSGRTAFRVAQEADRDEALEAAARTASEIGPCRTLVLEDGAATWIEAVHPELRHRISA